MSPISRVRQGVRRTRRGEIAYRSLAVPKGSIVDMYLAEMKEVHLCTTEAALEMLIRSLDPNLDLLKGDLPPRGRQR